MVSPHLPLKIGGVFQANMVAGRKEPIEVKPLHKFRLEGNSVTKTATVPAPIAYIKLVAVKKLLIGFLPRTTGPPVG